jgi:hypothetical protein
MPGTRSSWASMVDWDGGQRRCGAGSPAMQGGRPTFEQSPVAYAVLRTMAQMTRMGRVPWSLRPLPKEESGRSRARGMEPPQRAHHQRDPRCLHCKSK